MKKKIFFGFPLSYRCGQRMFCMENYHFKFSRAHWQQITSGTGEANCYEKVGQERFSLQLNVRYP